MTDFEYPPEATPIELEEAEGLLLPHITNRAELNRWEQDNIVDAESWAFQRRPNKLLSFEFILQLHQRMFGTVWRWAGTVRRSEKNIGVDRSMIRISLAELLEDTRVWVEENTYPADEIAARFHHRLVSIHPFPNGNGRHARLMTDLLLVHELNRTPFSWGSNSITDPGECRTNYINALRAADRYQYDKLLKFVRT